MYQSTGSGSTWPGPRPGFTLLCSSEPRVPPVPKSALWQCAYFIRLLWDLREIDGWELTEFWARNGTAYWLRLLHCHYEAGSADHSAAIMLWHSTETSTV